MNEIKPTSFRISEDTAGKFKKLANDLNFTQADFFDSLINTYELETAKGLLGDRKKEVEEFRNHAQRLIAIYLNALEINKNTEEKIREKFVDKLQKKEEFLSSLQDQVKQLKDNVIENEQQKENAIKSNRELEIKSQQLQDIADAKVELLKEYAEKINTLSGVVTEYKGYKEEIIKVKEALDNFKNKAAEQDHIIRDLEIQKSNLNKQIQIIEINVSEHKETLDKERDNYKKEISSIKNEYKEDLNKAEQKLEAERAKMEKAFEEKLNMEKEKIQILIDRNEINKNKEIDELKREIQNLEDIKDAKGKKDNK